MMGGERDVDAADTTNNAESLGPSTGWATPTERLTPTRMEPRRLTLRVTPTGQRSNSRPARRKPQAMRTLTGLRSHSPKVAARVSW